MAHVADYRTVMLQRILLGDMISESDTISTMKDAVGGKDMAANDSQEEKHHYRKIETIHKPGTLLQKPVTRIVIMCSDCGETKVIEL